MPFPVLDPLLVQFLNFTARAVINLIKKLRKEFPDAGLLTDKQMSDMAVAEAQSTLDLLG